MPSNESRVIAVVVCHNGRAFLRETFRGLARQTRPIDDVIVVDTGSTDGSADWARSRLGEDAVLAVRGQFGRAVMSALRDQRAAGMEWVWLLHDDSAPEPDALERLLAEAGSRPGAQILGPKLVSWSNPDRLQEVGWSVDRTGRAVSPIEDDEIDQGQHDQVREMFFVNTAGMLVRRSALLQVGGFDERMPAFRDDLDLCWRMHLQGGRVLVVPSARVRHFAAASTRARRSRAVNHSRYLSERHTTAALLKAVSFRRLPLAFLLALVGGAFRALGLTLTGRPGDALQILWAWGWNVKELPVTLVHRRRLQSRRRIEDSQLAGLRAPGGQPLRAMLRGMLELVYGDVGEHVAQAPNAEEQDVPAPGAQIGRIIAGHPVAFTVAGFALLMVISMRSLLTAPAIAGGALAVFPPAGRDLLREFAAAYHQIGLGSAASTPPSLAVLGGLATLTLNKALLAQKLLLWLVLPLAATTCTRALRVVVPSLAARAAASLLYASSPLAVGALAQGRLGELSFLVLAPPALAQVVLTFRRDQPREPWRPAVRFLVLAALAIAMYPPAAVVFLAVVALASVAALLRDRAGRALAVRQAVLLGAGYLGALALLFPWTGQLLSGAALRSGGTAAASPSFADLLQLRPGGPGLPGGSGLEGMLIGPLYPALALAALFFAPPAARRKTFWLLVALLGACVAVTLQVHGLTLAVARDWPAGLLVPGAVAWAAATGLAMAGLGLALRQSRLSLRRLGAAVLGLLAVATGLLVAGYLVRGSWDPLHAVRSPSLPATVRQGQSRVLWLASRAGGGVSFAVTGPDGRTLVDSGRPGADPATRTLGSVVTDVVEARTHQAGSMLELFGIGYVAVRSGPGDSRLVDLVARQQELRSRPTDQAGLFQAPLTAPTAWLLADQPPANPRGVLTGTAPTSVPGVEAVFSGRRGARLPARATGGVPAPGPATLMLPVPAGKEWRASLDGTPLTSTTVFGWAQGFKLPDGVGGALEVRRGGQQRRMVYLLIEGLLLLMALATLARPTRAAPPAAPVALDDTTTTDLKLATLAARGGAR